MKNLLLVLSDPIAMGFYLEVLRTNRLNVEPAPTVDEAVQAAPALKPDAIILDLVHPRFHDCERAGAILDTTELPGTLALALPIGPEELRRLAANHRQTYVLPWNGTLSESLLWGLGIRPNLAMPPSDVARARRMRGATEDAFQTARNASREYLRAHTDTDLLHAFFYSIHVVAHRAHIADLAEVAALAGAIESFLLSLYRMPEQVDRSVLQTLSQGLDIAGALLNAKRDIALRPPPKCRVLAIDDDKFCCDAIEAALKRAGLEVESAYGMPAALAKLHRGCYDLVLLDVSFPYSNGFEICQRLRSTPQNRNTPVLFLTGMPSFQNRVQSSLSGGNEFLAKPFKTAELPVKVLAWIYRSQLGLIPEQHPVNVPAGAAAPDA